MIYKPSPTTSVSNSVRNTRKQHNNNYVTSNGPAANPHTTDSINKRKVNSSVTSREYSSNPQEQVRSNFASTNNHKQDPLNALIIQYLDSYSYTKTAELFRLESQKPKQFDVKGQLLAIFDAGVPANKDEFFAKLHKKLPHYVRGTQEYRKIEMYVQIYFLVCSRKPGSNQLDKAALEQFKLYIEDKGRELSEDIELIPYFALRYMPEPHKQPAVSQIFKPKWASDLRDQLSKFLASRLNAKEQLPKLQQIYLASQTNSNNNNLASNYSSEDSKRKLPQPPQLKPHLSEQDELRKAVSELSNKYKVLQDNYKEMAEAHKSNILESENKWFALARDLVRICKRFIAVADQNKLITGPLTGLVEKIKKWEVFLSNNVEDLITQSQNGLSLFDPSFVEVSQQYIAPSSKALVHRPSIAPSVFSLDYSRIRETLLHSDDEHEVCLLLQALRWRITKQKNAYKRRQVIMSYTVHDILGLKPENRAVMYSLFDENAERKKQYSLRLVNAIASDFNGRTYVISNLSLVEVLVNTCKGQAYEGAIRRCALNALQKVSLRSSAQLFMIGQDIIKWIVQTIRLEKDQISEVTLQYLTALLMNMTLKKSGKVKSEKEQMLQLLVDLLQIDIPETRTFICGSIFSLLDWPPIVREAQNIRLAQQLTRYLHQEDSTTQFTKQITYILQKLEEPSAQTDEPDDDEEENDNDDIEDEDFEDEEQDPDEDEQPIPQADGLPKGEELLVKRYSSVGPEAARQELLTRSILDEAIKKNLQASMIREKRGGNKNDTSNLFKTGNKEQFILRDLSQEEHLPDQYDSNNYLPNYKEIKKNTVTAVKKAVNAVQSAQKVEEARYFEAKRQLPRTPPNKQK